MDSLQIFIDIRYDPLIIALYPSLHDPHLVRLCGLHFYLKKKKAIQQ